MYKKKNLLIQEHTAYEIKSMMYKQKTKKKNEKEKNDVPVTLAPVLFGLKTCGSIYWQ